MLLLLAIPIRAITAEANHDAFACHSRQLALSALGLAVLTGCASVSLDQNIHRVNDEAGSFTGGKLALARTLDERDQRAQAAQALLAQPLEQKDAVQLALVNSPSLQTLLAQGWAESADAAQAGRIANPIFSFERMVAGDELEFGRALSFGLLDLLTLPARHGGATRRIEQAQLRLTSDVVDQITRVRQSWVRAVAAQQTLKYAKQVYDSAEAGAELAKRMQAAGNFNRITRAREQAFYADAATRLSAAQHQATASREELVRLLGLVRRRNKRLSCRSDCRSYLNSQWSRRRSPCKQPRRVWISAWPNPRSMGPSRPRV